MCKKCGTRRTGEVPRPSYDDIHMAVSLWRSGLSRRLVGIIFGVHETTVFRWEREFGQDEDAYIEEQLRFLESKQELFQDADLRKFNKVLRKVKRLDREEEKKYKQAMRKGHWYW